MKQATQTQFENANTNILASPKTDVPYVQARLNSPPNLIWG